MDTSSHNGRLGRALARWVALASVWSLSAGGCPPPAAGGRGGPAAGLGLEAAGRAAPPVAPRPGGPQDGPVGPGGRAEAHAGAGARAPRGADTGEADTAPEAPDASDASGEGGALARPPSPEELRARRRWARTRPARCARLCRRVLILTAPEESLEGRHGAWLDACRRACVRDASEGQLRCLERVRVAADVVACQAR